MAMIKKSQKLSNVCYDIRGPVMVAAEKLEREGHQIIKLNTGNPAPFGFQSPAGMKENIITNIDRAQGYVDSKGIASARQVVLEDFQAKGFQGLDLDDIYLGNGVSELISMVTTALLDRGDEVLIPSPDYPLWTAAVTLAGGTAVHYRCDEQAGWLPDLKTLEKQITPRTVGLVIINPNNPTGAVYPREIIEGFIDLARRHELILFSDEIYDRIIYTEDPHWSPAVLADDLVTVTFNGLSKVFLSAGFRAGWMAVSGPKKGTEDFREGLNILSNMRLCGNVFSQLAVEAGLSQGLDNIRQLLQPGGRLREQRDIIYQGITQIPGVSCVEPKGALYLFPKLDRKRFNISNDEKFVLDFLNSEKILLVHGRGFNWPEPDHFRIVFLPPAEQLHRVVSSMASFLANYRQE